MRAARANMNGPVGSRSLGFAVIDSIQKGDGRNYRVAVTDGNQDGVIIARLSGSLLASSRSGDDPETHLVERLQGPVGSLPNDGNRWLNIVLQEEPLSFG